jgi:choline kinase
MRPPKLQALILAAGRGTRLRPFTERTPKTLLPVAGKPILGRTIETLERAGVGSIVVVTGYRSPMVRDYVASQFPHLQIQLVSNPIYARTNTIYSLWVAKRAVQGGAFLLIDGDLLFDDVVLRSVLAKRGEAVLACDGSVRLDKEAVRAYGTARGGVVEIGKDFGSRWPSLGESIGLAKISAGAASALFRSCRAVLRRRGGPNSYYEAAFQNAIAAGLTFSAVDIQGHKWTEIDTKADLRRARAWFKKSETPAA